MKTYLEYRWQLMCKNLRTSSDTSADFKGLMQRYSAAGRHHHNSGHPEFMLRQLEPIADKLNQPLAVELAVWFHDAIQELLSTTNEEECFALVKEFILRHRLQISLLTPVEEMILASRHQDTNFGLDSCTFLDLDLAILSAEAAEYKRYEDNIRLEYSWVPLDIYVSNRKSKVIDKLLERPRIYLSPFFEPREMAARFNLNWSIEYLSQMTR